MLLRYRAGQHRQTGNNSCMTGDVAVERVRSSAWARRALAVCRGFVTRETASSRGWGDKTVGDEVRNTGMKSLAYQSRRVGGSLVARSLASSVTSPLASRFLAAQEMPDHSRQPGHTYTSPRHFDDDALVTHWCLQDSLSARLRAFHMEG